MDTNVAKSLAIIVLLCLKTTDTDVDNIGLHIAVSALINRVFQCSSLNLVCDRVS